MELHYNDPYELPQKIVIPDGDPEALKEILDFLNEDARLVRNAEHREHYHVPYHLEAMDYEGSTVAYRDTPERILLRREEREQLLQTLSTLTDAQLRRLTLRAEGWTLREIAALEGASVNAVRESLEGAKRKFQNIS